MFTIVRGMLERLKETQLSQRWTIETTNLELNHFAIHSLIQTCKLSTDHIETGEQWLVIRDKDRIIGCVTYETRGALVHIQSLCTHPDNRGQGVARSLIDHTFEHVVRDGQTLIAMTLFWNNPFYRHLGFDHLPADTKKGDDVGRREKHRFCTVWGKEKQPSSQFTDS